MDISEKGKVGLERIKEEKGGDGKMYHSFMKANPGVGFTWIIQILIQIFSTILPVITPTLKKELEDFLLGLYNKAKETANPWDDFLMKFLLRVLGIPVPGE